MLNTSGQFTLTNIPHQPSKLVVHSYQYPPSTQQAGHSLLPIPPINPASWSFTLTNIPHQPSKLVIHSYQYPPSTQQAGRSLLPISPINPASWSFTLTNTPHQPSKLVVGVCIIMQSDASGSHLVGDELIGDSRFFLI